MKWLLSRGVNADAAMAKLLLKRYGGEVDTGIAAFACEAGIVESLLSGATPSPSSSSGSTGGAPRTHYDRTTDDDQHGPTASKERDTAGGTEEGQGLRRVAELSRQVQGLSVGGETAPPKRRCGEEVVRLKKCSCLGAFYCSVECQKRAWPSHKPVCSYKKK